ncbi:unnamed protein product [Anisakis simplex]|uniref:COesterase domain-containing protein n=1 Tax=Anisakis simplex TaxID=6269 RepID=A0A0M3JSA6_ANISI|nr:unnamed protein product [Anisakis simplex]
MGFTAFTTLEVMSYLQNQNPNVFLYEFDHYSAVGRIFEVPGWQPVPHTAELPFVLMQKPLWDLARLKNQMTPEDRDIADFFGRVWTNFARTGIKCNADNECPRWNATVMKCNQMPYLEIAAKRRMMPDYRAVDRATILGVSFRI